MGLPSGYKRLEYIESTGTQYINTGVTPNQNTKLHIKFQTSSAKAVVAGSDNGYKVSSFMLAVTVASFGSGAQLLTLNDGAVHTVEMASGAISVDGVSKGSPGSGTLSSSYPMYIAANNRSGETQEHMVGKLYECAIYNGTTKVRDYIPCKNTSGVVGMWDDVNSQFYTNAGTGAFTAGPPLVDLTAHKTLVGGTAYTVKGGKCMVGGTVYSIKKGRTLIGGTGYDVTFDRKLKVTITGTGDATYAWVEINGVRYTGPATVEVDKQTVITCYAKTSYPMTNSGIFINNTLVAATSTAGNYSAVYNIDATADMSIELVYGTVGPGYLRGSVYITK